MVEFLMFEPDRERAELLRANIKEILSREKRSYSLTTYFNCDDTLKALTNDPSKYDIVVINFDDEEAARKIAEKIRKRSIVTTLVFLGNDYEKLSRFLMLRPSAMLPYASERETAMMTVLSLYDEQSRYKQRRDKNRYFLIRNRDELERIPYEHIDFFESSNRKVYLHNNHDKKIYEFNAKIDDVTAAIPITGFIRCHQSCLVNLANVRRIDKTARQFIMFSGKTVDISKRSMGEVATQFENFSQGNR